MIRKPLVGNSAVCALALSPAQSQAVAQQKPFKIDGGGAALDGIPLPGNSAPRWAVGNANYPGKYYVRARSKCAQQPRGFLRALLARFGPTTPTRLGLAGPGETPGPRCGLRPQRLIM
jgi:hypothetical protein